MVEQPAILTPEVIQERITYLQDDTLVCQRIMRSKDATPPEKGECRMRALRNRQELIRLQSTLVLIQAEKE